MTGEVETFYCMQSFLAVPREPAKRHHPVLPLYILTLSQWESLSNGLLWPMG